MYLCLHTPAVWNPANQLRLVVYPTIYQVSYIPGGFLAGFLKHQTKNWARIAVKTKCCFWLFDIIFLRKKKANSHPKNSQTFPDLGYVRSPGNVTFAVAIGVDQVPLAIDWHVFAALQSRGLQACKVVDVDVVQANRDCRGRIPWAATRVVDGLIAILCEPVLRVLHGIKPYHDTHDMHA